MADGSREKPLDSEQKAAVLGLTTLVSLLQRDLAGVLAAETEAQARARLCDTADIARMIAREISNLAGYGTTNPDAEDDIRRLRAALEPFAWLAPVLVDCTDDPVWSGREQRASIHTWLGPSDFCAARRAFGPDLDREADRKPDKST